jgi:two-component system cell cycle response regulator
MKPVGRPLRVLVAEDERPARDALVEAVRLLGHQCCGARDGLEAWEIHQREHVDVILSDWQMPRMDGLELCRRTRLAYDDGDYTYFILMTTFTDKDHFVRGMEAGADDYYTKPADIDELRARLVSAGRVVALYHRLAEKNAVLRTDSQRFFRVARVDALTGVANRLAMDEELRTLWSRVVRYGHRYSLAICDVDRFKAYNDHFGHLAGDEVLRRVAQTIRSQLREGDGLYRYGGEEFVALLPEQSLKEAGRAMDRVRVAVERIAIPAHGGGLHVVTVSAGVAELDRSTDRSPEDSLRRADAALYRAKSAGRNCIKADHAADVAAHR